ncbi:MAG TPA: hypothetical protein VFT64_02505 [Rickettsiales bacterium]|nr:hypothetical protein [Rickettsiales bacterium]
MLSAATKENANEVKSDVRKTVNSAKRDAENDLEAFAHNTGRKARHYFESASEHLADTAHLVEDEIRDNPMRSTLLALGAGFLLGALFRR